MKRGRTVVLLVATAALVFTTGTGAALADKTAWSIDSATPTVYVTSAGCSADVTTTYTHASAGKLEVEAFVNGVSQGVQTYAFNGKGTETTTSTQVSGAGGSSFTFALTLVKQGSSAAAEATTTTSPTFACGISVPQG